MKSIVVFAIFLIGLAVMICLDKFFPRPSDTPTPEEMVHIEELRKRKRRQYLLTVPFFLVMFVIYGYPEYPQGIPFHVYKWMAIAAGAVTIGVLIFSYFNWRCPACKSYLGKSIPQNYCRKCGARLR